ncbi:DUF7878 domain-containing protein [Streptomyces pinistramenti]|uniref:DUF7878 domain-containing protein n=1 Tax=Streptomyces pinistramenti TaxID=2884812 RepID=UPI001D08FF9A|nr:hypothetical protein [Streptomyces pinistramenti]MCB5908340.1 hypothetical protein [Streptomyces pinistramenti]
MEITYENLRQDELSGPLLAELLISLEADFTLADEGREILSEPGFPVAELAYLLTEWLDGAGESDGFIFDSMSAEPGWVRIERRQDGWAVGSVLEPGRWTRPVELDVLVANIREFVQKVRTDLAAIGIEPYFLPAAE